MSVALALQKRIIELLKAALEPDVRVYQNAPAEAPFPHVSIGRVVARADDTHTTELSERLVYLSVWSRFAGSEEAEGIIAGMKAVLHNADLNPLDDGRAVLCRVTNAETRLDQDEITYMGSVTVRVVTQDSD